MSTAAKNTCANMRPVLVLLLIVFHAGFVANVGHLPNAITPAVAATIYVPLWPLASAGFPVFGRAESGGWPGPSILGWVLLGVFWSALWWLFVSVIARVRS
jgi:hypothetical protein